MNESGHIFAHSFKPRFIVHDGVFGGGGTFVGFCSHTGAYNRSGGTSLTRRSSVSHVWKSLEVKDSLSILSFS